MAKPRRKPPHCFWASRKRHWQRIRFWQPLRFKKQRVSSFRLRLTVWWTIWKVLKKTSLSVVLFLREPGFGANMKQRPELPRSRKYWRAPRKRSRSVRLSLSRTCLKNRFFSPVYAPACPAYRQAGGRQGKTQKAAARELIFFSSAAPCGRTQNHAETQTAFLR